MKHYYRIIVDGELLKIQRRILGIWWTKSVYAHIHLARQAMRNILAEDRRAVEVA